MHPKSKNDGRGLLDEASAKPNQNNKSTWWTPQGFTTGEPPAAYAELRGSRREPKEVGYELIIQPRDEFSDLQVMIYTHKDHLHVQVWNHDCALSEFFVARSDEDLFFATWYVEFRRSAAQVNQAECLERIARTLTAFVRHGHGEDTIDEFGEESRDDENRRVRLWEAKQARKAKEAK